VFLRGLVFLRFFSYFKLSFSRLSEYRFLGEISKKSKAFRFIVEKATKVF
jgi:hypothetical protein